MKRSRVAIIGAKGQMGRALKDVIAPSEQFTVAAEIDYDNSLDSLTANLVDAVIDFSSPDNLKYVLSWCSENQKPVVVGTTGFSNSPQSLLLEAGKSVPVLWSANMSLGIAFVQMALRHFSLLKGFDFQIEEVHHSKKKDAPSGTAVVLQKQLGEVIGRQPPPVLSIRAGQVYGIHRLQAFGPEEMITIEHQALNRHVFARGALTALGWLLQQKPGLYSTLDIFADADEA
jgi:4-hydroxy-tetrahydrodipicolinate reductase